MGPKILAHRRASWALFFSPTNMISFPVGTFAMSIFVSKHWSNYTFIRQVRRGLFSCTLPRRLTVSFGMRWIWFSNILDLGKIYVAGSRSSFRALCPLSCLMGGRWIHLNWVQEFVKGTHYRQRCLCSLLSHSSIFCVPKYKDWVSNVGLCLIRLSVLQMTVLVSCITSGTPKSFSDMSTSIVWLPACDSIRPRLWCYHFGPGQRLPSLYDWNCNNWASRLWAILGEPNCLEFTMVHNSVVLTVFSTYSLTVLTVFSTYSLICRLDVHYGLIELVLFAARC